MSSLYNSAENYKRTVHDQAFWTRNTSTEPVAYDFHMDEGGPVSSLGIEAQADEYEPHALTIYAADEPELTDDELAEYEARIAREDRPDILQSVRRHVANALRSASDLADVEGADLISRDLLAALASLDSMKGGSANA